MIESSEYVDQADWMIHAAFSNAGRHGRRLACNCLGLRNYSNAPILR
jgi:hypothetical protein